MAKDKNSTEDSQYIHYIFEHRLNVEKAFDKYAMLIMMELGIEESEYHRLRKQISSHDLSKYGEEEFDGYRQYFYPVNDETQDEEAFNQAWKHHYKANPHHWEYWVDEETGKASPMTMKYLLEMICDWIAMSVKFGGNPREYYNTNKDKINLHPSTRKLLEGTLRRIFK